jgi:shikimate kinase
MDSKFGLKAMPYKGFLKLPKTIALVGMMGVGKTSVGRLLAKRLGIGFCDSDHEVETAAQCTVADIYAWYGEQAFKDTERRVISRLVTEPPQVLSTGVEAFITPETREVLKENCFIVWLHAPLDTIYPRVERRSHRPQLEKGDKRKILESLIEKYYPIYAEAHIKIDCTQQPLEKTVDKIIEALEDLI